MENVCFRLFPLGHRCVGGLREGHDPLNGYSFHSAQSSLVGSHSMLKRTSDAWEMIQISIERAGLLEAQRLRRRSYVQPSEMHSLGRGGSSADS
jgi:hypothetical protein